MSQMSGCGLAGGLGDRQIMPVIYQRIALTTYPSALWVAGRVIADEDAPFDFNRFAHCRGTNPCPAQLQAIADWSEGQDLERSLHFIELSIRSLADGTWVVAHGPVQYVVVPNAAALRASKIGKGVRVVRELPVGLRAMSFLRNGKPEYGLMDSSDLDPVSLKSAASITPLPALARDMSIVAIDLGAIDSSQFSALRGMYADLFDVYRLDDFATHNLARLFVYMLHLESAPNRKLIRDIDDLQLDGRMVIRTRDSRDADWIDAHQGSEGAVSFTARVSTPAELDSLLSTAPRYGSKLWAIEIDKSADTADMVRTVNNTRYISLVDSTPYDREREASASACAETLVAVQSNVTTTRRPLDCMSRMKVSKPW